jgi:hypothetical protein
MPLILTHGLGTDHHLITQGYSSDLVSAANSSLFSGGLGVGQRLVTQGYGPASTTPSTTLRLACISMALVPGTSVGAVLVPVTAITAELVEC